jgi:hypothetical protein
VPILWAIHPEGVYLPEVRHSIRSPRISIAGTKPEHGPATLEHPGLALHAREGAIQVVYNDVIPESIADWPQDRLPRSHERKHNRLLRNVALSRGIQLVR